MQPDGGRRRRRRRRPGKFAKAIAQRLAARADRAAGDSTHALGAAASEAAAAATSAVSAVYRAVAGEASSVARARALRARNRVPLASLPALHPEASSLPVRSLGVLQVPVDEIAGTAVGGPDQRGSDFRPLAAFRGADWRARWLRIRAAMASMAPLPPVDLQKYAGRYWVVDGHNRVAAALYEGQVEIDAVVHELVPPGAPSPVHAVSLAVEMAEGALIRTAAAGRRPSLALVPGLDIVLPRLETDDAEPDADDPDPDAEPEPRVRSDTSDEAVPRDGTGRAP
jgi:hypothetical protein